MANKEFNLVDMADIQPEKSVNDYNQSIQQKKLFIKPPQFDTTADSLELMFIQNEFDDFTIKNVQNKMLSAIKQQALKNKSRLRYLLKHQSNLRKRFIRFNHFLRDCHEKHRTAVHKIVKNKEQQAEISKKINESQKLINELIAFREKMKKTIAEYAHFKIVMEEAVNKSVIFESINDCMNRCDAMMMVNVEIDKLQSDKLQQIEEINKRMIQLTKTASLKVLGLKNELSEVERAYSELQTQVQKLEKILNRAKDFSIDFQLKKEQTTDIIYSLYKLLTLRSNINNSYGRRDIENHLDFILQEYRLMKDTINEYNRRYNFDSKDGIEVITGLKC